MRSRPPADPRFATACTCGRLRRAARALTQVYDDALAPDRLTVTQFALLRILARDGATRISDLARAALIDRTAIARVLDPLARRRLVAIDAGDDARTRVAKLTAAGARAFAAAESRWRGVQDRVARRLGPDKVATLIGLLQDVEALHPDPGGLAR